MVLSAGSLNPEQLLFADHADMSRHLLTPERVKWISGTQSYVDRFCKFSDLWDVETARYDRSAFVNSVILG